METLNLTNIESNIDNFVWFRLSKCFNKLFNNYTVNPTVDQIYRAQKTWNKATLVDLQILAMDMFDSHGFSRFKQLVEELNDPKVCEQRLYIILYICVQLCKLYIEIDEEFAVKYFIQEVKQHLTIAINKANLDETDIV